MLNPPQYKNVINYLGPVDTPHEIWRRRKWTSESMRRLGTPVLIKHMYNIEDYTNGDAKFSPNYVTTNQSAPANDPFSFGTGFCSTETQVGEWVVNPGDDGLSELVISENQPEGSEVAPKYKGYGPGYLTYAILPDAPIDIFKRTEEGALIQTQQARVQLPWWPYCGDNDLLIVCEIDATEHITATYERYQLKQVSPITMRGKDLRGRRSMENPNANNRFWVGAFCEMSLIPKNSPLWNVETDR